MPLSREFLARRDAVYLELLTRMLDDSTVRDNARELVDPGLIEDSGARELFTAILNARAPNDARDVDEGQLRCTLTSAEARAILERLKSAPSLGPATAEDFASLVDSVQRVGPLYLEVRRLADVRAEPIQWLWPGRIPFGKITILEGDPGLGKSTLTVELAACVTTGRPLPNGAEIQPRGVLFLSYEDTAADTIKPRLLAAGGDDTRAQVIVGVVRSGEEVGFPEFPRDADALEYQIIRHGAKLVVIDPLTAALSAQLDFYKDTDVRRALSRLARVAERTGAAVVLVRHLTKKGSGNAITAGAGSIGITGAARVVLVVSADATNPAHRILAVAKSNLAKKPESLKFSLVQRGESSAIRWEGTSPLTADELAVQRATDATDSKLLRDEATDFLAGFLADGPKPRREVLQAAQREKFSDRTIERARQSLRITSSRKAFGGAVSWSLPDSESAVPPQNANSASSANPLGNGAVGEVGGNAGREEELCEVIL